jgi:murein DD-endopeptidase MepM/ murein hydrolase activator NlpD
MTEKARSRQAAVVAYRIGRAELAVLTIGIAALSSLFPAQTQAGFFSDVRAIFEGKAEASTPPQLMSVQTIPLVRPAMNHDPNPAKGGAAVVVEDGSVLRAQDGPGGTDIAAAKNQNISVYVVREGDTLSEIAEMFGVTMNTIKWANDIPPSGTIRVGQKLTILPVTGVKYTAKKGDTFESVAKKYEADADEIRNFNGIENLVAGSEIIIPDGEIVAPPAPKVVAKTTSGTGGGTSVSSGGGYTNPLPGSRRTQGIHGYNGVDLAGVAVGTPVLAAAGGEVIIARSGGYNGGYGSYVVIRHDNGTQTLYAHMSSVRVGVGQTVSQGQAVGGVGNSGRSTAPHLHFEIRGARNPF